MQSPVQPTALSRCQEVTCPEGLRGEGAVQVRTGPSHHSYLRRRNEWIFRVKCNTDGANLCSGTSSLYGPEVPSLPEPRAPSYNRQTEPGARSAPTSTFSDRAVFLSRKHISLRDLVT